MAVPGSIPNILLITQTSSGEWIKIACDCVTYPLYQTIGIMQSRQVIQGASALINKTSWLEELSWAYKVPASFIFGCFLGLSSAGFEIWWLAWIGLAPLLILLRGCKSLTEALLVGTFFGFGYHAVSLSWYLGLAPLGWLKVPELVGIFTSFAIWILEIVHQSILYAAFAAMVYSLPLRAGFLPNIQRPFFPYAVSISVIWVFLQWIVSPSELFVGLPINQLAYSQYKQLSLVQIVSVLGPGSLDFMIVLFNCCIANFFLEFLSPAKKLEERTDKLKPRFGAIFDLLILGLLLTNLSHWGNQRVTSINIRSEVATARHRDPNTPPVPLAVLQGNVSIAEERLKITKPEQIKDLYKSLGQNLGALILCLPEGVINSNQMVPGGLLSVLENISRTQNKEVIAGSIETLQTGHANAARLLSPESIKPTKQASSLYLKNRLVPLGESAPIDILNKRIPAPVRERIPASRESFIKASSTNLLKSIWGDVGLSIYIELFYPRLIADEVRKGANLLVNVSNLSWFHESSLKQQLIAAGVFRAVENGRFLVISTNTGVSAIIAPSGMISNISLSGHRGVLLNTIQFLYRKTPFSRMWWM